MSHAPADATKGSTVPVIDKFVGNYSFLSNFSAARVELDGRVYLTVEHAYQAAKTDDPQERLLVERSGTAGRAKQAGRRVTLRPDWDQVKVAIMRGLLEQKFAPGRVHLEWLLATGDAELIEGNTWGDQYWGMCRGRGLNMLGRLLMDIRRQRREEQARG